MITNPTQLEGAFRHLSSVQNMLEGMRLHCQETHSPLFPIVSEGYLRRIEELNAEIVEYLRERPAESPLRVRVDGPDIKHGIIKATFVSRLIAGLQAAMYRVGGLISAEAIQDTLTSEESLRSVLSLNMVATAPGSFVLAMDIAPRQQPSLFGYNVAESTVERIIEYVGELKQSPDKYSGDRVTLRTLSKVATLVKQGIESIEVVYNDGNHHFEAEFNPTIRDRIDYLLGKPQAEEMTVIGTLIEIDIKDNSCKVLLDDSTSVPCNFDETLEDDLIVALKRRLEMAGQFVTSDSGRPRITKIERFKIINADEDELLTESMGLSQSASYQQSIVENLNQSA